MMDVYVIVCFNFTFFVVFWSIREEKLEDSRCQVNI